MTFSLPSPLSLFKERPNIASCTKVDCEQSLFCSRNVETNAYVELLMAETAGRKYRGRLQPTLAVFATRSFSHFELFLRFNDLEQKRDCWQSRTKVSLSLCQLYYRNAMAFKCIHGRAPEYLSTIFTKRSDVNRYTTRSSQLLNVWSVYMFVCM